MGPLANGAIYEVDADTGDGTLLVTSSSTTAPAAGLAFDERGDRIFAAAGAGGGAFVYDAQSGDELIGIQFTPEPSFVNDVVVTKEYAWFTDSRRPVLYRMSLENLVDVQEVPLGGAYTFDPSALNANGIVAFSGGSELVVVHSSRGELYKVDPDTGEATLGDLDGESLVNGEGLVAKGRDLYVVQNRSNQVSVVRLGRDRAAGEVQRVIENDGFRVPSTAAVSGPFLFVVNARFDTQPGPDVEYDVVRGDRK